MALIDAVTLVVPDCRLIVFTIAVAFDPAGMLIECPLMTMVPPAEVRFCMFAVPDTTAGASGLSAAPIPIPIERIRWASDGYRRS